MQMFYLLVQLADTEHVAPSRHWLFVRSHKSKRWKYWHNAHAFFFKNVFWSRIMLFLDRREK